MRKHRLPATLLLLSLAAAVIGWAWIFIEADLMGSSDPNIGAAGLATLGGIGVVIFGLVLIIQKMRH